MGLTTERNLNQQITYWAPGSRNSYNELTFEDPVLLNGRWTEKTNQKRSLKGDELTTMAEIHLNAPVVEGGWLGLGDQRSVSDPAKAGLDPHVAAEIVVFESYPDLRNIDTSYKAYI